MNRSVKAFDAITNSVVMGLQRSPGATVKLTLEIESEAPSGLKDENVGVVRDNRKQLKVHAGVDGVLRLAPTIRKTKRACAPVGSIAAETSADEAGTIRFFTAQFETE
jgi:hypothetical protein